MEYGLDRWTWFWSMKLENGGLHFLEQAACIAQTLEDSLKSYLNGKTVTLSLLTSEGLISGSKTYQSSPEEQVYFIVGAFHAYIATNTGNISLWASKDVTLYAVKLELGDRQTLAHKEGDKWVLNDPPPNMEEELVKCQRYYVEFSYNSYIGLVTSSATYGQGAIFLPVPMRATPALAKGKLGLYKQEGGESTSFTPELRGVSAGTLRLNASSYSATVTPGVFCVYVQEAVGFSADL